MTKEEIEKKYLLRENGQVYATSALNALYSSLGTLERIIFDHGTGIKQGYLPLEKGKELAQSMAIPVDFEPVEARLREAGGSFFLTLKGVGDVVRKELERRISPEHFNQYWPATAGKRLEKLRWNGLHQGLVLEFDLYTDRDLILAEIEVTSEKDLEELPLLGQDVTQDRRYRNENLAK